MPAAIIRWRHTALTSEAATQTFVGSMEGGIRTECLEFGGTATLLQERRCLKLRTLQSVKRSCSSMMFVFVLCTCEVLYAGDVCACVHECHCIALPQQLKSLNVVVESNNWSKVRNSLVNLDSAGAQILRRNVWAFDLVTSWFCFWRSWWDVESVGESTAPVTRLAPSWNDARCGAVCDVTRRGGIARATSL